MGWSGDADYVFKVPSQILADGEAQRSEIGPKGPILSSLLTQIESSFLYTYSPAQGWLHKVTLESIGPTEDPVPHCIPESAAVRWNSVTAYGTTLTCSIA